MDIMNLLSFFTGIGLFLYGIDAMGQGLEYAAGSKMKKVLGALTKNRFLAVIMGANIGTTVTSVLIAMD